MNVVVIDSSVLINLTHLELASKLSLYFDSVLVPRRVHEEVSKKSKFRRRLNKLYRTGFFQRCVAAEKMRVLLLRHDLDWGEAEGLVQAQENGAQFFIADERRARQIGQRRGLVLVGTVGLLARLALEGHAPDTNATVRKLQRDRKFRVAEDIVQEAIEAANKPISQITP